MPSLLVLIMYDIYRCYTLSTSANLATVGYWRIGIIGYVYARTRRATVATDLARKKNRTFKISPSKALSPLGWITCPRHARKRVSGSKKQPHADCTAAVAPCCLTNGNGGSDVWLVGGLRRSVLSPDAYISYYPLNPRWGRGQKKKRASLDTRFGRWRCCRYTATACACDWLRSYSVAPPCQIWRMFSTLGVMWR